jgi:ubiquinone/menaquinone biosynthesis C-methylase UbiE
MPVSVKKLLERKELMRFKNEMELNEIFQLRFSQKVDACPLCNSTQIQKCFSLSFCGISISRDYCSMCGLIFQNPRLDAECIKRVYTSGIYWGEPYVSGISAYRSWDEKSEFKIRQSHRRIKKILQLTGLNGGKLLDVACATGFFAYVAREYGFEVVGLDPSPQMVNRGRKIYGVEIYCAMLEEFDLPDNEYDLLTLWSADSHFLNPLEGFSKLARTIKHGGFLVMNYQDSSHWIRSVVPGLKKNWNVLYHLSKRTLEYLMEKIGLTIVHYYTEWQLVPLDHLFRVMGLPDPRFLAKIVVSIPAIGHPVVIARKP